MSSQHENPVDNLELELTATAARTRPNFYEIRVPKNFETRLLDEQQTKSESTAEKCPNLDSSNFAAQARQLSETKPFVSIENLWKLSQNSQTENVSVQGDAEFFMSDLEDQFDRVLSQTLTQDDPYPEEK